MQDTTKYLTQVPINLDHDLQQVRLKDAIESFIAGEAYAFEKAGFNDVALLIKTSSISQMENLFQSATTFLINQSTKARVKSKERLANPDIWGDFLDIIHKHEKYRIIEKEILKKHFLNSEGKMIKCHGKIQLFSGIIILIRDNGYFKKSILDQKVTGKTIVSYVKRQYGIDISHQFYRNKGLSELAFKQFPLFEKLGLLNKSIEKQ